MRCSIIYVFVAVGSMICTACTQTTPNETWEKSVQTVEQQVTQWLQDNDVPSVSIAMIREGDIAWTDTFGEQSAGKPATHETLYNVASLTKPVTAELFLRLAQSGDFQLDEPLWEYWIDPDVASDPRHKWLTPRLSLSHQTGFQNWRHERADSVLEIRWDPGTEFGYSGEGYRYAAKAAENKLGHPFENLANEHLFTPLNLDEISYVYQPEFEGHLATPKGPQGAYGDAPKHSEWNAAGDILATSKGYANFLISVMGDKGLGHQFASRRYVIDHLGEETLCDETYKACLIEEDSGYALGWGLLAYKDETIIMHRGGDWGVRTLAYFIPETGFGLVVLTNGSNGEAVIRNVVEAFHANDHWLDILHK